MKVKPMFHWGLQDIGDGRKVCSSRKAEGTDSSKLKKEATCILGN